MILAARGTENVPPTWLVLAFVFIVIAAIVGNWTVILARRMSSHANQERWLAKQFDGEDVVEFYALMTRLPPHNIALIAYSHGYVFARSYASSRDFNHTYVFRKLFTPAPTQAPVTR
ncbi:MAG: hypothetical protein GX610_01725 [Rhodococcus sp.]|nr:hypothetical protein [Rhodococcus sp. (in: high G+C Gram-positive bacteria)]